jgi:magnesium-transporting ATPase (P-type)
MYVKGAPDRLFPLCNSQLVDDSMATLTAAGGNTTSFNEGMWIKAQEQLSSQGLRVLALCRWVPDGEMWVGWMGSIAAAGRSATWWMSTAQQQYSLAVHRSCTE